MNLKLSFIYCALIIIVRYQKKNVHSCRFRHTPVLVYYINFLKCSLRKLSMVQFKIHSSFDDKHVNVYQYLLFSGKYQSASVINSLKDLLRNEDSNIRAVAAVSLAKTGNQDKSTINVLLKCLNDKDRLVRESGCLALGHMKAKRAVPKLLHLW